MPVDVEVLQLDFEAVKRIIPQRFPFLMLDRVVALEPGVRAVGVKNLTGNEWFYQGHFPKRAVTPGAMICEAVAQTGIVFFHYTRGAGREDGSVDSHSIDATTAIVPERDDARHRDVTYLLGAIRMRFLEPVWPGEQMRMEVTPVKVMAEAAMLAARVTVEERVAAKGEFMLSAKPNRDL